MNFSIDPQPDQAINLRHILIATLLCAAVPAFAAPAHVHGNARLDVAFDRARIDIHLEGPLDNLLGFEHAPQTMAQVESARYLVTKLRGAANLFVTVPQAGCQATTAKMESAVIPAAILAGGSAMPVKPGHGAAPHGDVDVDFVILCARPEALHQIEVRLFDAFPRLQKIDVQLAGPRGQTATRLTPTQRVLGW